MLELEGEDQRRYEQIRGLRDAGLILAEVFPYPPRACGRKFEEALELAQAGKIKRGELLRILSQRRYRLRYRIRMHPTPRLLALEAHCTAELERIRAEAEEEKNGSEMSRVRGLDPRAVLLAVRKNPADRGLCTATPGMPDLPQARGEDRGKESTEAG